MGGIQYHDIHEWWRDGQSDLWVKCPDCAAEAMIEYEIDDLGKISPEYQCPIDCGYFQWSRLVAYAPGKRDPSDVDIRRDVGEI